MSHVIIRGCGAVSPAGWGVNALESALAANTPLPTAPVKSPAGARTFQLRDVPPPATRLDFLRHPRLRRSSSITQYAAAAALEALGQNLHGTPPASSPPSPKRLGLITCMMSGCVQYTERFYQEVLRDPLTASPLLFPETVFNAPASHIGALVGQPAATCTLLGDSSVFIQALAQAAGWLTEDRVDGCLVISAEEAHWLLADALWQLDHSATFAAGAGALYLERSDEPNPAATRLDCVTDPFVYGPACSRLHALCQMRAQLPPESPNELLCLSLSGRPRTDAPELQAWHGWQGPRLAPKLVLGEGLIAAGAWQCVAACSALARGHARAANVSVAGVNQQAIGVRFLAADRPQPVTQS